MARTRKTKSGPNLLEPDGPVSEDSRPAEPESGQPEPIDAAADSVERAPEPAAEPVIEPVVMPEPEVVEPVSTETESPSRSDDAEAPWKPAAAPVSAARPPEPRRSGFFPTLLGGAIAAGLGFGAAAYVLPQYWTTPDLSADVESLRQGIAAQGASLTDLGARVDGLPTAEALAGVESAQSSISANLDALAAQVTELGTRVSDFDARLASIEKRPVGGGAASASALEAFGREMEQLRAEVAAQKLEVANAEAAVSAAAISAADEIKAAADAASRMREAAAEATRKEQVSAAIIRVNAALDAGSPLDAPLDELAAAGVDIPAALQEQRQGVPTFAALKDAFPPAAREALSISIRETSGGSTWDRLGSFLRSQSGARSLTPKEGSDPDAVLSRAEAALVAGDLDGAVAEITELPQAGQDRMAEWVDLAKRRSAALAAASALAQQNQ